MVDGGVSARLVCLFFVYDRFGLRIYFYCQSMIHLGWVLSCECDSEIGKVMFVKWSNYLVDAVTMLKTTKETTLIDKRGEG